MKRVLSVTEQWPQLGVILYPQALKEHLAVLERFLVFTATGLECYRSVVGRDQGCC